MNRICRKRAAQSGRSRRPASKNTGMRRSVLAGLLLILAAGELAAQPAPPQALELGTDPALEDGQVAIVQGVAGAESVRYLLSKLSVLQPVSVTLLSRETNPSLEISLHSPGWKDTARVAALQGQVWRTLRFRTQGDVGISIRSPDRRPQRFDLVAWVGSEVEPTMEAAVVPPEEFEKYAAARPDLYPDEVRRAVGQGTNPVLYVIATALTGIFLLLGFLVFRQVRS